MIKVAAPAMAERVVDRAIQVFVYSYIYNRAWTFGGL